MKFFKNQALGKAAIAVALLSCLAGGLAASAANNNNKNNNKPNPFLKPDESWISISGTVVDPTQNQFTLDYGKGMITVNMEPWSWYNNNPKAIAGDKVTVYGRVDNDTFKLAKIQASSVYDQNKGVYYYANSADENTIAYDNFWVAPAPIVVGQTTLRGTVTSINGRKFTIDTGTRMITVDTSDMPFNPLDNKGFLQVKKGDYVSTTGTINWKNRKLTANTIVVLQGS